ncbi:MAG: hypothetical protein ACOX3U_04480 [Christensenellales bacterium]|jgi:hypothetical protein
MSNKRIIQWFTLYVSLFFSSLYYLKSAYYFSALSLNISLDTITVIVSSMLFSLILTGVLTVFVRLYYLIAVRIYISAAVKDAGYYRNVNEIPRFPIQYELFRYVLIWFIIVYNLIMGAIRLIYFVAPYAHTISEYAIPPIINFIVMLCFYKYIRDKYISGLTEKYILPALTLPYALIILLLI